jgi:hypothetical protein
MKVKEGDICTLDESVEYSYCPIPPFQVLVLWNGVNGQPLVTKLTGYKPFWTTYSQLVEITGHIDLENAFISELKGE